MIGTVTRREAGWLLFDAPLPESERPHLDREDSPETLLGLGATLPSGCKIALVDSSDVRLRAELPEPAKPPNADAANEVEAAFSAAFASLTNPGASTPRRIEAVDESPPPDLETLCREAGWSFDRRSDGALVVDLGVAGAYVPAIVETRASGTSVEVTLVAPLPDPCVQRAALGALLLRANGSFRMVRAAFRTRDEESQAVLEAPLPVDASAEDLGLALGAVAVAARHCAVEARMLVEDERIARIYLNRCGDIRRIDPKADLMLSPTAVVG